MRKACLLMSICMLLAGTLFSASQTVTFTSVAAHDGYVDESSSTSNVGGTINSNSTTGAAIRVGDTGGKKQRKSIVSFDTSSLPDNAVITAATLKLKCGFITNAPASTLGTMTIDIKNTATGFSDSLSLQNGDFEAAASKSNVGTLSNPSGVGSWSLASLNTNGTSRIAKSNHTQFRIRFTKGDDDGDSSDDYFGFYSGEATSTADRPILEVTFGDSVAVFPVSVYRDRDYNGTAVNLSVGNYTLADLNARGIANNDISSLKVAEGYQALLFDGEGYQSPSILKTSNESSLADDGWNDRMSSLKVIPAPVFDTSKAVPLRSAKYRAADFVLSLRGSAINGTSAYESYVDTGSSETCLPYGCLNKTKLTVLQRNVRTCWGDKADLVKGQLMLLSRDGLTQYVLDDYTFFAMKNEDGTDMPDDRTEAWSSSIIGGNPSPTTLPYEMAKKYSKNGIGLGIISEFPSNTYKAYMQFGYGSNITNNLNWLKWAPLWPGQPVMDDPVVFPGWKLTFKFPSVNGTSVPDIVLTNMIATLDTGAPEMALRLRSDDPHRKAQYDPYFDDNVPWWYSPNDCQNVKSGVTVRTLWTGSSGQSSSFQFKVGDNSAYLPVVITVGDWYKEIPWEVTTQTPRNRFNYGNAVYRYTRVHFYDMTGARIGFCFR